MNFNVFPALTARFLLDLGKRLVQQFGHKRRVIGKAFLTEQIGGERAARLGIGILAHDAEKLVLGGHFFFGQHRLNLVDAVACDLEHL